MNACLRPSSASESASNTSRFTRRVPSASTRMRRRISRWPWSPLSSSAAEARPQRLELPLEVAAAQRAEQVVDLEQRIDLGRTEPDAGQLGLFRLRVEHVSALLARPDDRHVQAVAQVLDVALERGVRDLEVFLDLAPRQRALFDEALPDAVEALGAIHGSARRHDAQDLAGILVRHEVERAVRALRARRARACRWRCALRGRPCRPARRRGARAAWPQARRRRAGPSRPGRRCRCGKPCRTARSTGTQ